MSDVIERLRRLSMEEQSKAMEGLTKEFTDLTAQVELLRKQGRMTPDIESAYKSMKAIHDNTQALISIRAGLKK